MGQAQRARVNVVAATGQLGRRVVAKLLQQGARADDIVLSVRDPAKAAGLGFGSLEARPADYDDPASLIEAFRESDVLLLIPTPEAVEPRLRQHANALTAARECGVGRVVFSSFQACRPDSRFRRARFYREAEAHLRSSGLSWTIARSGLYLEFVAGHAAAQLAAGKLTLPVKRGSVACIARDDVARGLAAACFARDQAGWVYELTGSEAFSMVDLTTAIEGITGRAMEFAPISGEDYETLCLDRALPEAVADVWRSTWEAAEAGELARVTDHLERLTGYPAPPLADALATLLASGTREVP